MKLSKKSEYACLALIDLSEHFQKGPLKAKEISGRKKIPYKYLEQILMLLKQTGYIRSQRGYNGGYILAHKPSEISIAEIIRLIDGAIAPVLSVSRHFYSESPVERSKKLISVLREVRDMVSKKLEQTYFSDLI